MPVIDSFKRNVALVAVGVISAVLVTRVEPFKSNFSLAVIAGAAVGVLCAMIEVATRSIAKKLNPATHSSSDGPKAQEK
jgi:sensor histidine kinase regulating citrate/malate metabolism